MRLARVSTPCWDSLVARLLRAAGPIEDMRWDHQPGRTALRRTRVILGRLGSVAVIVRVAMLLLQSPGSSVVE